MVLCTLWGRLEERQITENLQTPIVKEFKGYADHVSIELFNIAKTIELLTVSMIRLEGVILT